MVSLKAACLSGKLKTVLVFISLVALYLGITCLKWSVQLNEKHGVL